MTTTPTIHASFAPDPDPFAQVPVAAGTLHATAQLLQELAEFLDTNAAARIQLGCFLITRHRDQKAAGDPEIEGALVFWELIEAAQQLRLLAGDTSQETTA